MPSLFIRRTVLVAALLLTSVAHAAPIPFIAARSEWRYLDAGVNPGTDWTTLAYNDSSWKRGFAELGYGDGDEVTVVSPGASSRAITTYFRQKFQVTDTAAIRGVVARLVRDDGAIVYVNGTEVWRVNMPQGTVDRNTLALQNIEGASESAWLEAELSPTVLTRGTNVVAVEIHQSAASSSDISFAFELAGDDGIPVPKITRQPYLQQGTENGVIVRWRTATPSDSRVRIGSAPGALAMNFDDAAQTTEHEVRVTGLQPFTRYYYSVGTTAARIVGDDADHTFVTSPRIGTAVPTRIWILGDSGTANSSARAVRNAYYSYATPQSTNLWLMLGDNAYDRGEDAEYQRAVFDMYPEMLRASVLWSTIGNHETAQLTTPDPTIPYYQIFTFPKNGEAGGVPSGTESYYSFDYGNIHFVCLDSMTSARKDPSPMLTWLREDLASTNQPWIIAFFHHPPYSKGSHDSDREQPLVEMRENVLPILEQGGVDLVLSGHSHSYERSYLIDGHYGHSTTFKSSMKVDGGDGRDSGNGAYRKPLLPVPHDGTVYAVAGSSGTISGGSLDHPAMFVAMNNLGSMILDIDGDRLNASFLRDDRSVGDHFTIIKGSSDSIVAPRALVAVTTNPSRVELSWFDASSNEEGFRIERCTGNGCTDFSLLARTAANTTSFVDGSARPQTTYRYRVSAFAGDAMSSFSNFTEVTTAAGTRRRPVGK